jgi:DNA ligase (NAD+)
MNIDSMGEEKIEMLFDKGLVLSSSDLYSLKYEDLLGLEKVIVNPDTGKSKKISLRQKSAENIIAGIEVSKNIPFERVLYAIGIRYVGETVAKKLALHFRGIDQLANADFESLKNVPEVGEKIANSVVEYFSNPVHRQLIKSLKEAGVQLQLDEKSQPKAVSNTLEGQSFVVSGVFNKFTRDEIKELIESHGGRVQSGVTAKTTYLVAGDDSGPSKLEKAKRLKVNIILESDIESMIKSNESKNQG